MARHKRHYPPHDPALTQALTPSKEQIEPDWTRKCEVCDSSPIVPLTGMCGPCTFGEADTVAGNW